MAKINELKSWETYCNTIDDYSKHELINWLTNLLHFLIL